MGSVVGTDQGHVLVDFDQEQQSFVELDGGGRLFHQVPFLKTKSLQDQQ